MLFKNFEPKYSEGVIENIPGVLYCHFPLFERIHYQLFMINKYDADFFAQLIVFGIYLKINVDGLPIKQLNFSSFLVHTFTDMSSKWIGIFKYNSQLPIYCWFILWQYQTRILW